MGSKNLLCKSERLLTSKVLIYKIYYNEICYYLVT